FGKTLCDPADWNARRQEFLAFTPAKLHPSPGPRGEHSYSKNITIGKRGHDCRVLLEDKAFRIVKPKHVKAPQIKWGENPEASWMAIQTQLLDHFIEHKMGLPAPK
ncbi:unnamed protein product, partial [Prorocentrum cordatum]